MSILLKMADTDKIRKKYFAHRGDLTHDRTLVNGLLHTEFSRIRGFFSRIHVIGRIPLTRQAKVGSLSGKGVYS
jgi:hypothetical protein